MVTIFLTLNKGRSSGRPSSEFPKRLYNRKTGRSVTVDTEAEQSALGDDWGKAQPDVKYPQFLGEQK